MADSSPSSNLPALFNTDLHNTGKFSGHPIDASNVVDAQNGPAFPIPTFHSAPRTTEHTFMGIRADRGLSQRANDPFDYEQKYPEDEEYQEMGPMARIWKVFLDECGKFDTEMVENWRDALDALLVFVSWIVFSAVVTTFVSQTCQNLQPDFQEINAAKMNEVSELICAVILNGTEGVLSIPRSTHTVASFRPRLSALWVNGLWFTSLALSLTTVLVAALTKQWIHQYMSIPSGTPRDRSRIRQFRYTNLQRWQVPVIIGLLLPVLMHLSLGVFFVGLTMFLFRLDTTIAGIIGVIAAFTLGVCIITNLLPLFKPGCPYKTPLTLHSHSLSRYLWHQFERAMILFPLVASPDLHKEDGEEGMTSKGLPSFKALEKERVDCGASIIDVQCLSWLFNVSSNSSVQRVVMQAVSNLPLQDSIAICEAIPSLKGTITSTMSSIKERVVERPVYERLFRALSRIEDDFALPRCLTSSEPGDQRISTLADYDRNPHQAAKFLRVQLVNPTIKMDVLSWALVMTSALHKGAGWLDVEVYDSEVWHAVLFILIGTHRCAKYTNCRQSRKELVTLTYLFPLGLDACPLTILDGEDTNKAFTLRRAINEFMFPSFTKLVLNQYDSSQRFPPEVPSDIALQLNLLMSPSVRAVDIWKEELWQCIELYLGMEPPMGVHTVHRHPELIMPMFHAFLDVVCADDFVETDSLTAGEKLDACLFLFRCFNLDPNLQQRMGPLLTPAILERILDTTFAPSPRLPSPLITDLLDFLPVAPHLSAIVYRSLRERRWLEEIEDVLSVWHDLEVPRREFSYDLSYPFLASAYVKGLEGLQRTSPTEYSECLQYLTPNNLFRISKLVLLAGTDRRQTLMNLASITGHAAWTQCSKELTSFLSSAEGQVVYNYHANERCGHHPYNSLQHLSYGTYDDLKELLHKTMHGRQSH